MKISATVKSRGLAHEVAASTQDHERILAIPSKPTGGGSAVNGGEFLRLALATCYCNDLYREATRLGIRISGAEAQASAEFGGIGLAASNVSYRARVHSDESEDRITQLLRETDAVAEVQNTVRNPVQVTLVPWDSESSVQPENL
jgi:organic hydroperoxide reductase OsmC/OhrA